MSYFVLILSLVVGVRSVSFQCVKCICEVTTGCKSESCDPTQCSRIEASNNNCKCGPFAITPPFWIAAKRPSLDGKTMSDAENFKRCVESFPCSIWAVQYYLERNSLDCDGDEVINCDDYVLMYTFGARKCYNASLNEKQLNTYETCMNREEIIPRAPRTQERHSNSTRIYNEPTEKVLAITNAVEFIDDIKPMDEPDYRPIQRGGKPLSASSQARLRAKTNAKTKIGKERSKVITKLFHNK